MTLTLGPGSQQKSGKTARSLLVEAGRAVRKLLLEARETVTSVMQQQNVFAALPPVITWKIENVVSELVDLVRRFPGRILIVPIDLF